MNDVPLVKANNIHDINTSIIAIKKQLKQLNEAVGLIDMPTIDTSIFVKKSEVVDVVEEGNMNPVTSNAVVPVDEVTVGNMHSVSSNAVANAIQPLKNKYILESGVIGVNTIGANNHIHSVIQLQHTYRFSSGILFMLTPVSYVNTAYITASGHWGADYESAEGLEQSDKITVYITNIWQSAQNCGCYWAIYGDADSIIS